MLKSILFFAITLFSFISCVSAHAQSIGVPGEEAAKQTAEKEAQTSFSEFLALFPKQDANSFSVKKVPIVKSMMLNWEFFQFIEDAYDMAGGFRRPIQLVPIAQFDVDGNSILLLQVGAGPSINFFKVYVFTKEGTFLYSTIIEKEEVKSSDLAVK
ncbi:MAG: hypothetical protein M3Q34_03805 [bacterium]|nr:hypothetical protein [bacterium]